MQLKSKSNGANSGDGLVFDEQRFRIGDESVIIGILRDKMYSDPIGTICQEIPSNARDAHREVGKDDVPIEITVPSASDLFYRVKDYGPSISPQRMKEVFLGYGLSTKRASEDETGCFGLGAKCPWAYTDWFEIVSITYEEEFGCNIRRHYRAYVDASNNGKLAMKDEAQTEEPQGTEFIIPVKENGDIQNFILQTIKACQYWKQAGGVLPKLLNTLNRRDAVWPDLESQIEFEGLNWQLMNSKAVAYGMIRPLAIVDGIPYKVDFSALEISRGQRNWIPGNEGLAEISVIPVRLFFNADEIAPTANREAIDYDKENVELILFRLRGFLADMGAKVSARFDDCKNLWEATYKYKALRDKLAHSLPVSKLPGPGKIQWQGHNLSSRDITCAYKGDYTVYRTKFDPQGDPLLTSKKTGSIIVSEYLMLCVDDTGGQRPSRGRLYTLFLKSKQTCAYVIKLHGDKKETVEQLNDDMSLDAMEPVYLSSLEPTRLPRKKTGPRKKNGKKIIRAKVRERIGQYRWDPAEIDLNTAVGYYVVKHYNNLYFSFDMKASIGWALGVHAGNLGSPLYAFTPSLKKKIGPNLVPLKTKLLQDLANMEAALHVDDWELELAAKSVVGYGCWIPGPFVDELKFFVKPDHVIFKYVAHIKAIDQHQDEVHKVLSLRTLLGTSKPDNDERTPKFNQLRKIIQYRYPLLEACSGCVGKKIPKHLALYVQMVDRRNNAQDTS